MLLDKQTIRETLLKRRKSMEFDSVQSKSNIINKHIVPFLNGMVALYMPIQNEVDVQDLFKYCSSYCLPRIINSHDMEFVKAEKNSQFKVNNFGIAEIVGGEVIKPQDINIIIVPLVGFDSLGNRIGYGSGYYDCYLKGTKATRIGVAYAFQEVANFEFNVDDEALDIVVCENWIKNCKVSK